MNVTEKKAFKWLKKHGAIEDSMTFQATESPDFLTNIGNFEVKKAVGHTVFFTQNQIELMKVQTDINILIFDANLPEPIVLSFSQVKEKYSVVVTDQSKKIINFRTDERLLRKLDEKLKRSPYKTRTEFFVDACVAFLEGRLHIGE